LPDRVLLQKNTLEIVGDPGLTKRLGESKEMNHRREKQVVPTEGGFLRRCVRKVLHSNEQGGAIIEMAVAMPVMLTVLTGVFSVSVVLYQKLLLSSAVSRGGAVLALERGDTDPCLTAANAIYAAAPGLSKTNLKLTFILGGSNGSGTITGGTNYGSNVTTCTAAGGTGGTALQAGWPAQIQATYPCSFAIYGVHLGTCSLNSQIAEVIQ
jgi:Flp pilus assembly protein TadG